MESTLITFAGKGRWSIAPPLDKIGHGVSLAESVGINRARMLAQKREDGSHIGRYRTIHAERVGKAPLLTQLPPVADDVMLEPILIRPLSTEELALSEPLRSDDAPSLAVQRPNRLLQRLRAGLVERNCAFRQSSVVYSGLAPQ